MEGKPVITPEDQAKVDARNQEVSGWLHRIRSAVSRIMENLNVIEQGIECWNDYESRMDLPSDLEYVESIDLGNLHAKLSENIRQLNRMMVVIQNRSGFEFDDLHPHRPVSNKVSK